MIYGCIGEHLSHSFSKEIHSHIDGYSYDIRELSPAELGTFMEKKDFLGINVTIPYKQDVIPYLYEISEEAKKIGAVNTIVNREGKLYGYNTDFDGMRALIKKLGADLKGKTVAILGTGGTSKTAYFVAESFGAAKVIKVSRTKKDGLEDYASLYEDYKNSVQVIINTTPCGMFPNPDAVPVDLSRFPKLYAVIDAIYNPLDSKLVQAARKLGVLATGGLYMLVAQAVFAARHFTGKAYPDSVIQKIYEKLLADKRNIVLVGMPGSGKSTVGRLLADSLSKNFYDTDEKVFELFGKTPDEIIRKDGEKAFRDAETQAIKAIYAQSSAVIATGGGAVLREENVDMLKQNGVTVFIDRPISELIPTADRPLSSTVEAIEKRYRERYGIYTATADLTVKVKGDAQSVADEIMKGFCK